MIKKFTVKPDHLKLLKKMCVGWRDCEFGAPEIDPKRPYGNSGVYGDIGQIQRITGKPSLPLAICRFAILALGEK